MPAFTSLSGSSPSFTTSSPEELQDASPGPSKSRRRTWAQRLSFASSIVSALPPYSPYEDDMDAGDSTRSQRSPVEEEEEEGEHHPPRYSTMYDAPMTPTAPVSPRTPMTPRTPMSPPTSATSESSQNSRRTEHQFHLKSRGKSALPWATLRVFSRPSIASAGLKSPRMFGGENITGSVDLRLDSPQNVQSISLSLKGYMITRAWEGGSYAFLDHTIVVWSKAEGDPKNGSAPSNDSKKFDGKLQGNYTWPFSFPFPTEVDLVDLSGSRPGRVAQWSPTPQTFIEKNVMAAIQYDLTLQITRGALRSDNELVVKVVYVPHITPDPPSLGRQLAYQESSILPSPIADPRGWTALEPAVMRGKLLDRREAQIECTPSLANPLSYTRGTVLPCYITIASHDSEALDLLCVPSTVNIRLTRRVKFYEDPKRLMGLKEQVEQVEQAVWWVPPKDVPQEPYERRLEGEIHLPRGLQPSCDFAAFRVEYVVELLPFNSQAFETTSPDEPVSSRVVTIATFFRKGPIPTAFTKPVVTSKKREITSDIPYFQDMFGQL